MARGRPLQNSFSSGEFSERLEGRVDIQRYLSAVRKLENMICLPHGGAKRRPGTHFVAEVKDSTKKVRLVSFGFSDIQGYILEFGNQYIRFYMNEGQIQLAGPYEISSPYLEADLPQLKYFQSADVMYLVHPNYNVRKLTRTDHTAWTLTEVEMTDGPYLTENADAAKTLTPSATTGSITLTATGHTPFQSGHVGSLWRLNHSGTWGYVKVTAFTSSTQVTATVKKTLGGITATSSWREGAWSTVRGFPRAGSFHEERAFYGGTAFQPQTIWGSKAGDYENMTPGTAADDAVAFTIAANKVNVIRWMLPSRVLLVGTLGGEFRITGAQDKAIEPANIDAKSETNYGSNIVAPLRVGSAVLFVQRSGRKLRELAFSLDFDAYVAPNITILAEHVFPKGKTILDLAYQSEEDPIVWAVRSDGVLCGMTYDRSNDAVGWHRHPMTNGIVESVAVVNHPDDDREQAWVVVKRTIQGATKRYIEFLDDGHGFYGDLQTDSALTYSGAPGTVFGGLTHLRGQSVQILGDGAVYPPQTVPTSGNAEVVIDPSASVVEVGLPIASKLETLRLEMPVAGTSQGLMKRWSRVVVRVLNSLGLKINGKQPPTRSPSDLMGSPPALVTEDIDISNLGWDKKGLVTVTQDLPLPLHILAVTGVVDVADAA